MSDPTITIEEVRAGLLKLESQGKLREPVVAAPAPAPAQEPKKPKEPTYEPSEGARRTQKLIEQIEQRRQELARMTAEKLRRGCEIDAELREAAKSRDAMLEHIAQVCSDEVAQAEILKMRRVEDIGIAYGTLDVERKTELTTKQGEINRTTKTLEQLRKQLDAELAKLDPDRAKVSA